MPSFELNKIIASVLTALIVAMVSGLLADELIRPRDLATPVFLVAATAPAASAAAAPAAAPALPPIGPLLAKADAKKGQQMTTLCQICHSFDKGGANKIGPNLWDVVGGAIAEGHAGYAFSAALEKHKGEKWDPEKLNDWLDNPQHFAPGSKMTFAGFPQAQNRADVIKYLESLH